MIKLTVNRVESETDALNYKSILEQTDPYNPYCRFELIDIELKTDEQALYYFTLHKNNSPIVLMPFYLRRINISKQPTDYFDVSSPWGYIGPLFHNQHIDILPLFWEEVDKWYKANRVVTEFIRFNFSGNQKSYSGTTIHTLSNIRGKLKSDEELWNGFKRSVRKNYKNAVRNELICKIYFKDIPLNIIEAYYSIWRGTMDRLEAAESYYHTFEYFNDYIKANEDCCALAIVALPDGKAISTELLLFSKDTMFSFLGGTDASYFNMRPNDLLKIEAMKWAREKGLSYYILGGGLQDGDTLYQYKKKFFPEEPEINFYTGRKIIDIAVYQELNALAGFPASSPPLNEDLGVGFFPKYRDQHE